MPEPRKRRRTNQGRHARASRPRADVPTAEKVAFLAEPASYPAAEIGTANAIEVHETHMSWVFLTPLHAWKLKKPVRYPFLDFSSIGARRRDCEAEVRLNRRLAPAVYLGTAALLREADGRLRLGSAESASGHGEPGHAAGAETVDWLVHMHRLPAAQMLDARLRSGQAPAAELDAVAELLVDFYRRSRPIAISTLEYRGRFAADLWASRAELLRPEYGLDAALVGTVHDAASGFLTQSGRLFDARVRTGRIVEAHGDLRPEHVCLGTAPVVIDCLEFRREFRILDPVDELAYLAMECERLGAAEVGARVPARYLDASGDHPGTALIDFYKCFRACLRAKIALWHTRDPGRASPEKWPEKWIQRAHAYLQLARRHAQGLCR